MNMKNTDNGVEDAPLPKAAEGGEDESADSLAKEKEELERRSNTIVFISLMTHIILIDFLLFKEMSGSGVFVIGFLELVLIVFVGKLLDIPYIEAIVYKILGAAGYKEKSEPIEKKPPPQ